MSKLELPNNDPGKEPDLGYFGEADTLFDPNHIQFPAPQWGMEITYDWDSGKEQMPVGMPPPGDPHNSVACQIIQVSAPFGEKIIAFGGSRVGALPIIPSPLTDDPNLVLKRARVTVTAPPLDTSCDTHVYRVRGFYRFFCKIPPWAPTDNLSMGSTPYDKTQASQNTLNPSVFVAGLF